MVFLWRGPLLWSNATAIEHTRSWQVCLRDQRVSPFTCETSGPLLFVWATTGTQLLIQNYRPYIDFSSPTWKYEYPLRLTYFLFMVGYWNLRFCFPVICWFYLQTEIYVNLSIGNKLYFRHPPLSSLAWEPLCWYYLATALNLLSPSSSAKLVYIYIYIYIVIHRQICFVLSELFSEARQARFPKLGSKPGWLKHQSKILLFSYEGTSAREGNLNGYVSQLFLFTYIRLTATERSIHMKSLALR